MDKGGGGRCANGQRCEDEGGAEDTTSDEINGRRCSFHENGESREGWQGQKSKRETASSAGAEGVVASRAHEKGRSRRDSTNLCQIKAVL